MLVPFLMQMFTMSTTEALLIPNSIWNRNKNSAAEEQRKKDAERAESNARKMQRINQQTAEMNEKVKMSKQAKQANKDRSFLGKMIGNKIEDKSGIKSTEYERKFFGVPIKVTNHRAS